MSTALMAPRRNKRNEAGRAIAQAILENYQPQNAEEMQVLSGKLNVARIGRLIEAT